MTHKSKALLFVPIPVVAIVLFLFASVACGPKQKKAAAFKPVEQSPPKTAAEARQICRAHRILDSRDTVFLDYYMGMPQQEALALTKTYLTNNKLKKDTKETYKYSMKFPGESRAVDSYVTLSFYHDSLSIITMMYTPLWAPGTHVTTKDLYQTFNQRFLEKGYIHFFYSNNEFLGNAHEYFKGNTSICIGSWNDEYPMIVFSDEILAQAARAEAMKKKKMEDDKERNEALSDF